MTGWTRVKVSVLAFMMLAVCVTSSGWALFGKDGEKDKAPKPGKPAECEFVPATTVCLVKPQGFELATTFDGYTDTERSAWVMVSEIPEAYGAVIQGMTNERLEQEGLQVVDRRDVYLQGREKKMEAIPAQLLSVRQRVKSVEYFKWLLMFGDDERTLMVNAFYPMHQDYSKALGEELRTHLLALKWDPEKKVDLFANLSFRIKPQKGLKLAQRMQNTLLYTPSGKTPNPSPLDAMFIVGRSFFEQQIEDPQAFAKKRIQNFPTMKDVQIQSAEPIELDKLSGYEITAWAKDKQTSDLIALYQLMLFDGNHYYILVGAVGANDTEDYFDRFRKTARSFKKQ